LFLFKLSSQFGGGRLQITKYHLHHDIEKINENINLYFKLLSLTKTLIATCFKPFSKFCLKLYIVNN